MSGERHIAAQRQDDILDRVDSLPRARAEPGPARAPAAPMGQTSTRPRRKLEPPQEYWNLNSRKERDEPKKKPWVAFVESANLVALSPPNKPSIDALEAGKKVPIPKTFYEAVTREHAEYWKSAMDEEMSSFEANGVFELTELPESRKPVGGRWVYSIKRKRNEQGAVSKIKARWVAKGYSQREGIDFTKTYAPVSKMATLPTLLTIAADEDLELRQIDIKTAFLTANLVETVYMDQLTGYEQPGLGGKKLVAHHLFKAVYGLRQSLKAAVLDVLSTVVGEGPESKWKQLGFVQRARKAKKGDGEDIVLDARSGGQRQQTTFPLRSTRKRSESISLRVLLRQTWRVELLFMHEERHVKIGEKVGTAAEVRVVDCERIERAAVMNVEVDELREIELR
jgi:hypothetical protein